MHGNGIGSILVYKIKGSFTCQRESGVINITN